MSKSNPKSEFGFTPAEQRKIRALKTPHGIQKFLNETPYHLARSAWSPRRVLGFPPLIVDLEAENDTDHVIAVFKIRGHWGSIANSNYAGCRYREPVHRTLRELAISYFDDYFNLRAERTLRTFSQPVDLSRFDARGWMTDPKDVWYIPEYLLEISHTELLTPWQRKNLNRLDRRSYESGLHGHRWK